MDDPRTSAAVRAYRRVGRALLPHALWTAHGEAMVEAFRDLYADARTRGRGAVTAFLVREGAGLARTALVMRTRGKGWTMEGRNDASRTGGADAWYRDWWRDAAHAFRVLRKHAAYSTVVVLTLALGLAATAGVFTVVNGVLLRPLPYADADRLVQVWSVLDASTEPRRMTVNPADFLDLRGGSETLQGVAAHNLWFPVLSGGEGDAQRILGGLVTPEVFDVLGVRPLLGRTFRADESVGSNRVTVLSYGLWQSRYGEDPDIVGQDVYINGEPYEVVGVMPREYTHPDPHRPLLETALFAPFNMESWQSEEGRYLRVVGRLAPGTSLSRAQAELDGIARRLRELRPESNRDVGVEVVSLRDQFFGSARAALLLVLGAAGLLFLIVCANVANLVLARGLSRRREFAVRESLGAGRARIARQLLVENGILAVVAACGGIFAVVASMDVIRGVQGRLLPIVADIQLDLRVVTFAAGLVVVTTVLLGSLPLLELMRTPVRSVLGEESAGGGGSRRSHRIRAALVVGEVALAAGLVAGAGLLGRSFQKLSRVDPGFDAERVLTAELTAPRDRYPGGDELTAFYRQARERLAALPGVTAVGYASELPMVDGNWWMTFDLADRPLPVSERPSFEIRYVSPGYFAAMGIEVLAGRPVEAGDRVGSPRVVVVNEELANRFWDPPGAIGRRLRWMEDDVVVEGEIVGVVGTVLDDGLAGVPEPFVYFPFDQKWNRRAGFALRTSGDPIGLARAVRQTVRGMDPGVPVEALDAYSVRIAETIAAPRFASVLAAAFSVVALILAGLGIYGVLTYAVGARTREIGIRTALGARHGDVARLILRQSLVLTAVGVGAGLALAVAEGRILRSLLFDVSRGDALAFLLPPTALLIVGLVAAYLPVRRALAVEPVEALRGEGARSS